MPFNTVAPRRVRQAVLVLGSAASIALAAGPAQAMPLPSPGTSGPAVVAGNATSAAPDTIVAHGCNVWTCISVDGHPNLFTVHASQLVGWCGHFQFLFPHEHLNSGSGCNLKVVVDGDGAGKVCVIGWQKTGSTFTKVGEPCETVS
ncbi:MAG TPA: hypothetical protein VH637_19430 [Streptosporangiaceae bacterium]|jgi:hypothetical protein